MRKTTRMSLAIATMLVATLVVGCGSDDDDRSGPAPTPTATPGEMGIEHRDFEIGSTEDGGGQLDADFDFDEPISLFFNQCVGGEGEECVGGTRIYSAVNPGFVAHGHDEGHDDEGHDDEGHDDEGHDDEGHDDEGHDDDGHDDDGHDDDGHDDDDEDVLAELVEGTEISIEVVAIDAGLSLVIDGETLNAAGQVADLGVSPDFHSDAQSLLGIADPEQLEHEFEMTFRLTTTAPEYEDSEELTIHFEALDGEHDDDEGHEHE